MLELSDVKMTLPCAQCSHRTVWPFQLVQHVRTCHSHVHTSKPFHATVEPELYVCSRCDFKSNYKLDRYEHLVSREHDTNGCEAFHKKFETYTCDHCKHGWHSSLTLIKHQNSCNTILEASRPQFPSMDLMLSTCVKIYTYCKDNLKQVACRPDEKINWFDCDTCSYRSKKKSNFKRHLLKHAAPDEIAWLNCGKCSYRAKQKRELEGHMVTHATSDEIDWFACTQCSFRTKYKRCLKTHKLTHVRAEDVVWFECSECSFRSTRKTYLNKHVVVMHTAKNPDGNVDWFECKTCPFRSKRKSNLRRHASLHARKWFSCDECSYRTMYKRTLKIHMVTHSARAEEDQMRTNRNGDLNEHDVRMLDTSVTSRAEDTVVWFSCTYCAYRTKRKRNLNDHVVMVHVSNEQTDWFECAQCSYRAKHKKSLQNHMLSHARAEDIVWFSCGECSFRSKRKDCWRKHTAAMHRADDEIDWFNCDECSYRAKQKHNLKRHKLTHGATSSTAPDIESR